MIENSGEIKEKGSRITESGQIYFTGKHENFGIMEYAGLPIPDTLILGIGFDNNVLVEWLNSHQNQDINIRTSRKTQHRNSISFRETEKSELSVNNLSDFVNLEQAVILHALPPDGINHDSMSGICQFSSDNNYYYKNWEIISHPDIASLSNRFNLSSWWNIKLNGTKVENIEKVDGNREPLMESIYYRVGRNLLKKRGIIVPSLEEIEYKSDIWKRVINYCKNNTKELPEDHSLSILEKRILEKGLERIGASDIFKKTYKELKSNQEWPVFFDQSLIYESIGDLQPNIDDIELLRRLYPKFRKVAKKLNQFPQSEFPLNFAIKFSLLEYANRDKIPICWDIIKGT